MQNDANSPKEENTKTPTAPAKEKPICLFTQEEVTNTVRDFINSWMRGDIDFQFPNANEIVETGKIIKKEIDYSNAMVQERKEKEEFRALMSICSGNTAATPEQRQEAINGIFQRIITLRLGHRLEGKFTRSQVEDKLDALEENVKELNKHFEELYFYVKTKIPDDSILGKR